MSGAQRLVLEEGRITGREGWFALARPLLTMWVKSLEETLS